MFIPTPPYWEGVGVGFSPPFREGPGVGLLEGWAYLTTTVFPLRI